MTEPETYELWIQLADGQKMDLMNPQPEVLTPYNIAIPLSHICRFSGHTRFFYSVAQHSLIVAANVRRELRIAALLHDAHEAFWGFGDVARPAKQIVPELEVRQFQFDIAIAEAFQFDVNMMYHSSIKEHDNRTLATEIRDVMELGPLGDIDFGKPYARTIKPMPKAMVLSDFQLALEMLR